MRPSLFVLSLIFCLSPRVVAETGSRFALVIGNGDYAELPKLRNPVNDARDVAAALSRLGFEVASLENADLPAMEDAVIRFGQRLSSTADSTGFFFYAGHGVQSGGVNFLIPVDARIPGETFLKTKALPAHSVLDVMRESRNALDIVVLDACRDNPFSWGRSAARGLSVLGSQPPGSIVVYATSAGGVAQDGTGRNGVFTGELLKHISTPGLEVKEIFNRVGKAVTTITAGAQVPAVYSQFFDSAYLSMGPDGGAAPAAAPLQASSPLPASVRPTVGADLVLGVDRPDTEVWINGVRTGTAPAFIPDLPSGVELALELRNGDYIAADTLVLKPGETREISYVLRLGEGKLYFSVPSAADYRLALDGTDRGGLGSGLVKDIPAGLHSAELRAEGRYWRGTVTVKAGATATVKAQPWEVGTIRFLAPRDAAFEMIPLSIAAAARDQGSLRFAGGEEGVPIPVGTWTIIAGGPGYDEWRGNITVEKGESKTVEPWTAGRLVVETLPAGLEVFVDGANRGRSPVAIDGLGPMTVAAAIPGLERLEEKVDLRLGRTVRLSLDIGAAAAFRERNRGETIHYIASLPEKDDIYALRLDGEPPRKVNVREADARWSLRPSKDGKYLASVVSTDMSRFHSTISVIETSTSSERLVRPADVHVDDLAWSASGTALAYSVSTGRFHEDASKAWIEVYYPESGTVAALRLPEDFAFADSLTWTPDGDLVFRGGRGVWDGLYLYSFGSGECRRISRADDRDIINLALSPDGDSLYASLERGPGARDNDYDESVIARFGLRDGTEEIIAASPGDFCVNPTPSPDGRSLFYEIIYGYGEKMDLVLATPEGRTIARMPGFRTNSYWGYAYPNALWSPDSKRIFLEEQNGDENWRLHLWLIDAALASRREIPATERLAIGDFVSLGAARWLASGSGLVFDGKEADGSRTILALDIEAGRWYDLLEQVEGPASAGTLLEGYSDSPHWGR